ncbi:Hypothetical protein PHPALM_19644 [Phytophthora palmivora]|uniref:Uncharacterized protein n=1 Tax=Phytophthora palmivora TaxID=4796 RepID=A0A2P4XGW3_9STRA|nr:Hypothetical protein PHPALM_19644 [Phytophthora palmivora]
MGEKSTNLWGFSTKNDGKDFVIGYADHGSPDPTLTRLLAFLVNRKFVFFAIKFSLWAFAKQSRYQVSFAELMTNSQLSAIPATLGSHHYPGVHETSTTTDILALTVYLLPAFL